MLSAGIDIGSSSTKAVIMDDGGVAVYSLIPTGAHSATAASRVMELVLEKSKLNMRDIAFIVSTGYGRGHLLFHTLWKR